MFTYLLLRGNKQSGPYSLEELKISGIEATDLLWIEGRSTGWHYPDEIEELQAFVITSPETPNSAFARAGTLRIDHKEDLDNKINASSFLPPEAKANPTEETKIEKEPVSKRNLEIRKNLFPKTEPAAAPSFQDPQNEGQEINAGNFSPADIIKVIIADDHTLFREGVKTALGQKKDIKVVAEAENGVQLLHQLKHNTPDVILLDIQMPVMDGISALASIRKLYPDMKVIVLSMHEGHSMISTMMETGANGYLTKTADPETIYQAIKTCHAKSYYFNELTNLSVLEGLRSKNRMPEKIDTQVFDGANLMMKLTAAQRKSARYSSPKTQKRILFATSSILLIGAGIIAGMSIMGRSTQGKQIVPAPPKKGINLPVAAKPHPASSSQLPMTDSSKKISADSLQKKIDEEILSEEKNRALVSGKKDIAGNHKRNKADSSRALTPVVIQKIDSSANKNTNAPAKQDLQAAQLKALARNSIRSMVTATVNEYHKGTFGGLSEIEMTVSNRSTYTLDEVTVEVQYLLANAKLYKTETLNFQNIAPSSSVSLEAPKSSRGARVEYRIVSVRSKELDL